MGKIQRFLFSPLKEAVIAGGKVVVLYGPRQVGKTTLVEDILASLPYKTLVVNADEERFADVLSSRDRRVLLDFVHGYDLLFIDEAQRVPEIGLNLKILIDSHKDLRIIVTGSSSLDLASGIAEPLTGRKWTYHLYPISQLELSTHFNRFELQEQVEERLIWGSYPELFSLSGRTLKERYLRELSTDYLYKDVLKLVDVRNSDKIRALLRLLAFQIGSQVSFNELASQLEMSKETVTRYVDLLTKTFVIFPLSGFSKNLRKEVSKSKKIYFYDVGLRNVLIEDLRPVRERRDTGALWENFLIAERLKRNNYHEEFTSTYFWRTYTGAEIDYLEERQGKLVGFEMKYGARKPRPPKVFLTEYENAAWQVVNEDNWLEFVL